ncbi:PadR family transcriptional regulator [Paenibacillus hexagrammi]|uniref:PadR family transcriptional regulator n=1 Tax=Paenibacillus hexagrammi TaxID=2908839 RepID=A0ABY3SJ09_9BACL|nr:PadR family transcriptional regulator [Paenibacillus sp. YPD9-1]UJF33478.1 PadR family transcriptional regulator [Paenibacillus sp. YPD9-1]
MNTLSYGLLSILTRSSKSGYELMQHIQPIWKAKHSQIYPLLAQLEQNGFVQHVHVHQTDKPDKKVYSITSSGQEALRTWIHQPTGEPVHRDELLLKIYCIGMVDAEKAKQVVEEREAYYRKMAEFCEERMKITAEESVIPLQELTLGDPLFGPYVLLEKALLDLRANIEWCEWVKSRL